MSCECCQKKNERVVEAHIYEVEQKNVETEMKVEAVKKGRSIMMRKYLVNLEKEVREPVQRNNLFINAWKTRDKVCKVIKDIGSTNNLVSIETVENLRLETTIHSNPYMVS
jgi:hypothetical protein